MRLRAIIALAVAAAGAFLIAPAAHAAPAVSGPCRPYPPAAGPATVAVSTTDPRPGETITVSGANFAKNTKLEIVLHSNVIVLGTVTTDAQGSFTTTVKMPSDLSGQHELAVVGGTPDVQGCPVRPISFLGIQPGNSGNPPGTSFTGVDVLAMILGAAALIGIGVALNRGGKRRRTYANDIG
jgi:hypothetical protein